MLDLWHNFMALWRDLFIFSRLLAGFFTTLLCKVLSVLALFVRAPRAYHTAR